MVETTYPIRVKPVTTAPRTPQEPQGRDTFQTPNYATDLLLPYLPRQLDNQSTLVWEPAAGDGMIANRLEHHGFSVFRSDIRVLNENTKYHNFVEGWDIRDEFHLGNFVIVTNPPFSIKDLFIERAFSYGVPFAFLINADYSQQTIEWIRRGCQKIIPTSRIAFITPNIVNRINEGEDSDYTHISEIPNSLLYKYSSAQFHSMWLTWGLDLGSSEVFVDLPVKERKENIF